MKALVLFCLVASGLSIPTTLVQFNPSTGYIPGGPAVAPGFAYAFHALVPPQSPTVYYTSVPSAHVAPPAPIFKTQYHSQDELGQYAYGYVGPDSSKHEIRTADGGVRGSYSFIDSNGLLQSTDYIADRLGYRLANNNLPYHQNINSRIPQPVQETAEVQAARAAHLRAFELERRKHRLSRNKRDARILRGYNYNEPRLTFQPPKYPTTLSEYIAPVHSNYAIPSSSLQTPFHQIVSVSQNNPRFRSVKTPFGHSQRLIPVPVNSMQIPQGIISSPFQRYFPTPQPQLLSESSINLGILHPVPEYPIPNLVSVDTPVVGTQVLSQYHSQDELGQYSYGYSGGPSSKQETRTADGVVRGSYSYIDGNSDIQTVHYIADVNGFRVAATNLPEAPIPLH